MSAFNLFVYDDMMRCILKHVWYLPRELKPVRGKTEGNLYICRIPNLAFPGKAELGTSDYEKDIEKQESYNRMRLSALHFHLEYGRVYGELFRIENYKVVLSGLPRERAFLNQLANAQTDKLIETTQDLSEEDGKEDNSDAYFLSEMHYFSMVGVQRSLIPVDIGEEELVWAWTYHYPGEFRDAIHILTGDYCDYCYGLPDRNKSNIVKGLECLMKK